MRLIIVYLLVAFVAMLSQASAKYGQSIQNSLEKPRGPSNSKSGSDPLKIKAGDDGGKKLVCYYMYQSVHRMERGKFTPEDIPADLCTHIILVFRWMDYRNKSIEESLYKRLVALKIKNPKLKVLLAANCVLTLRSRGLEYIAGESSYRKTFISDAITFLRQRKFDGLELNLQNPNGRADKNNFVDLVKELREATESEARNSNNQRLILAASLPLDPVRIRSHYDVPALARYLDFMNVMADDFYSGWDGTTSHSAPLFSRSTDSKSHKQLSVAYAAELWVEKGAPKDKLIIGIPTYGRSFILASRNNSGLNAPAPWLGNAGAYTKESGILAYYEICEKFLNGSRYKWDDETQVPYLVRGKQWIGFDDERSVRNKMKWMKEKGYGGVAAWTLDYDDFTGKMCGGIVKYPLISAMREELFGIRRCGEAKDINWSGVTQKIN